MADDYQPISCVNHERLEFAALTHQWMEIEVVSGEHAGKHHLQPLDVYAREGTEWLEAKDRVGNNLTLRLDWLRF